MKQIARKLGVGMGRTAIMNDFVKAVNTWAGLKAIDCQLISQSRLLKILQKEGSRVQRVIIISEKKRIRRTHKK